MSFKIVIFAAAVFASQANAQIGLIRPFATGFTNGISEMAKPFVQLGQSVVSPASEYFNGRRPSVSQWMAYPSQIIPQAQGAYDTFENMASSVPGASYFQAVRPPTVIKPQTQYFQIPNQAGSVKPPRPYPASVPSIAEEAAEAYRPSSLLRPNPADFEIPQVDGANYLQGVRPPTVVKPQSQYLQVPNQVSSVKPPRPNPASVSALAEDAAEEAVEAYRPSNLLKPSPLDIKLPRAEEAMTLEGRVDIPSLQRPVPFIEDNE